MIVRKQREIYVLKNVRFHIDKVEKIGKCIEIEVRGEGKEEIPSLRKQMDHFLKLLGISKDSLIEGSYSDLLLANKK